MELFHPLLFFGMMFFFINKGTSFQAFTESCVSLWRAHGLSNETWGGNCLGFVEGNFF